MYRKLIMDRLLWSWNDVIMITDKKKNKSENKIYFNTNLI